MEWTRQGAPPALACPTALGTHLWKTLGQAATAGDRCCRPPPQRIGGGAASSAVRQQGGQHACRCCHAACSHASHSLMIETERENGMASVNRSRFTLFVLPFLSF